MMRRPGFYAAALPVVVLVTAGMTALQNDMIPASLTPAASATGPLKLTASLSERSLYVARGDSTLGAYAITVGLDEHPTPTGTFKIRKLVWNPRWVPPDEPWARNQTAKAPGDKLNPMKVVKMFFNEPDYYIHGTADLKSLGGTGSHGCLRMNPDEAAEVARWLMEHGGEPRAENWFLRILHSRREEKVVYLRNPIALTITE